MLDRVRHSLIHLLDKADAKTCNRETNGTEVEAQHEESKISSVNATPSRSRVWCIGGENSPSASGQNSPK